MPRRCFLDRVRTNRELGRRAWSPRSIRQHTGMNGSDCRAYDQVLALLHDRGQPSIVREMIAVRMLDLASKGERDIGRLCQGALGLPNLRH
jgi:hypothetical protein